MRVAFLPHNYSRQMYQRLPNLKRRVIPNNRDSHWESGLKIDVFKFKGSLNPYKFLDWDSPPIHDDYPNYGDVFNDGCLFTSTTTSSLVVDLSKPPSFDEEPFIEQEPYIEEEITLKKKLKWKMVRNYICKRRCFKLIPLKTSKRIITMKIRSILWAPSFLLHGLSKS